MCAVHPEPWIYTTIHYRNYIIYWTARTRFNILKINIRVFYFFIYTFATGIVLNFVQSVIIFIKSNFFFIKHPFNYFHSSFFFLTLIYILPLFIFSLFSLYFKWICSAFIKFAQNRFFIVYHKFFSILWKLYWSFVETKILDGTI